MTTIVTRAGKGAALTYAEMDANFTNLNNDKLEVGTSATSIVNTPSGSIAATNVQAAINELATEKAGRGTNYDITTMYGLDYPLALEGPVRAGDLQQQSITKFTSSGTADALVGTMNPEILSYSTGLRVTTVPVGANTITNPTLDLNPPISPGSKVIRKRSGSGSPITLVAGDYNASGPFTFEYDGTYFILLDPLNPEQQLPSQTGYAGGALVTNGTAPSWGSIVNSGVAVTASGTAVDFTGIPSWARKVTVLFDGISTNGTSSIQCQLGDAGGIENSGYTVTSSYIAGTITTADYTTGVILPFASTAIASSGKIEFAFLSANKYIITGQARRGDVAVTANIAGSKTLSDTLTQLRITTVNGTDVFDAGTVNITWE